MKAAWELDKAVRDHASKAHPCTAVPPNTNHWSLPSILLWLLRQRRLSSFKACFVFAVLYFFTRKALQPSGLSAWA